MKYGSYDIIGSINSTWNVYNSNNGCKKLCIENPEFMNPSQNRGIQPIPQMISVYSGPRGLFLYIILLPLLHAVTF
jgi:hypothetical protein